MKIKWFGSSKRNLHNLAYYPINPERDWRFILIGFFVLVFVGAAYEARVFLESNPSSSEISSGEGVAPDRKPEAKDPLLFYKNRSADFEKIKQQGPPFVDPAR